MNPCNTAVNKKIFKRPQTILWQRVDKETIDEVIFRTMHLRNRVMLELMDRRAMKIGAVLNLKPADIQERTLAVQNPKTGRVGGTVYVPGKLFVGLNDYVGANDFSGNDRIIAISYVADWSMVKKAKVFSFIPICQNRGSAYGTSLMPPNFIKR